ncbi:hypothetical protein ABT095_33635 [Kitasatospora sp. NPDC002227]|uniref:hypothetical protein n=1 Tax=Kitasatospora sp. NPDC002227 TaxID=3154773 RepID=UPI00331A584E
MRDDRPTYPDPLNGRHRILSERAFRYLEEDLELELGLFANPMDRWVQQVLACPVCEVAEGLELTLIEFTEAEVWVRCPDQHEWSEPRLNRAHFVEYSRFRFMPDPDPESAWLTEAGYGEEPPPPVDKWAEGREAAVFLTKYFAKKAKRKIKAQTTGRAKKALRRTRRKAKKAVIGGARAAGRALRGNRERPDRSAGPEDELLDDDQELGGEEEFEIPSYAKYRKAMGIPAPTRGGPRCLVCSDSGRITAPGVDIPCSECRPGAGRSRKNASRTTRVSGPGVYAEGDLDASVANTGGGLPPLDLAAARPRSGYRIDGVRAGGRITGRVQSTTAPTSSKE